MSFSQGFNEGEYAEIVRIEMLVPLIYSSTSLLTWIDELSMTKTNFELPWPLILDLAMIRSCMKLMKINEFPVSLTPIIP